MVVPAVRALLWLAVLLHGARGAKPKEDRAFQLSLSQVVNERAVIFRSAGYLTYRIPALLALTADSSAGGPQTQTVLAFAEERRRTVRDTGDINVVVRRSEDGGRTWGPYGTICDFGSDVCGNPAPVEDARGNVHVVLTSNPAANGEDSGRVERRVWVVSSSDQGVTWTSPREITASTKRPGWQWYATGPGHGIRLRHQPAGGARNGRLVVPCDHTELSQEGSAPLYESHVIFSDDDGQSWQLSEDIGKDLSDSSSEASVAELSDGTLLLSARNYVAGRSPRSHQLLTTSRDGGRTWGKERGHPELDLPDCEGSIGVLRPSRPSLLESYGNASASDCVVLSHPSAASRPWDRRDLRLLVSADGGRSWPRRSSVLLHGGDAGYSDLQLLADGTLLVVFETGVRGIRAASVRPLV